MSKTDRIAVNPRLKNLLLFIFLSPWESYDFILKYSFRYVKIILALSAEYFVDNHRIL